MALKCCNKLCQIIETIALFDTENQRHRLLVVGRCKNPKCGALKGEFVYWDRKQQKFIYVSIPKNELKNTITKFKKLPFLVYEKNHKYGTLANMSWTYHKNGKIYDFNDVIIQKLDTVMKQYDISEGLYGK